MEKTTDKKESGSQGGQDSKPEELFLNELRELYGAEQHHDIVEILELSLFEEKEMDELLTAVAENYINKEASRE
jgi:ferritin-like metal-binding protein YciE